MNSDKYDIISLPETRITKNINKKFNVNLNNVINALRLWININKIVINPLSLDFTPTESSAGGTLIYVANHLAYKQKTDLKILKMWLLIYFYCDN